MHTEKQTMRDARVHSVFIFYPLKSAVRLHKSDCVLIVTRNNGYHQYVSCQEYARFIGKIDESRDINARGMTSFRSRLDG
jgi:hypothetical protein